MGRGEVGVGGGESLQMGEGGDGIPWGGELDEVDERADSRGLVPHLSRVGSISAANFARLVTTFEMLRGGICCM